MNIDKNNQSNEKKGIWNVCQQFYKKGTNKTNSNNHSHPFERKRIVSIPTRSSKEFINRSTLSSFYQLEKKKKKKCLTN